jgi:hypothetical protein
MRQIRLTRHRLKTRASDNLANALKLTAFPWQAPYDFSKDFHVFGGLWDSDNTVSIFVDGRLLTMARPPAMRMSSSVWRLAARNGPDVMGSTIQHFPKASRPITCAPIRSAGNK